MARFRWRGILAFSTLAMVVLAAGAPAVAATSADPQDTYGALDKDRGSFNDPSGRQQVACGTLAAKETAVLLVAGQSNASNDSQGFYEPGPEVYNFNLFDGNCYKAKEPLLGATGRGGTFSTRLADAMIRNGLAKRVVIAPIAVGGTRVEEWAPGGVFHRRLLVAVRRLHDSGLQPTAVLWQQGEGNVAPNARKEAYEKNFREIAVTLRQNGVTAPILVAVSTVCANRNASPELNAAREQIRAALREVVDPRLGVFAGPDTDAIGPEDRWKQEQLSDCHFARSGLQKAAELWLAAIARVGVGSAAR